MQLYAIGAVISFQMLMSQFVWVGSCVVIGDRKWTVV